MAKGIRGQNPLVLAYGLGPAGKTCKGCTHCRYPLYVAGRHWKCDLRILTRGRASDHSPKWPACSKFTERNEDYHGG